MDYLLLVGGVSKIRVKMTGKLIQQILIIVVLVPMSNLYLFQRLNL
jgi:hypothetical protein